jgi:hypothetical protein
LGKHVENYAGSGISFYEFEKLFEDARNGLPFFTKLSELHAWAAGVYKETSDNRFRSVMFQIEFQMQQGGSHIFRSAAE